MSESLNSDIYKGVINSSNGQYIGEIKDGKKHGKGVFTLKDGTKYDGEWQDDKEDGKGLLTFSNKSKYDGEWEYGKKIWRYMVLWCNFFCCNRF